MTSPSSRPPFRLRAARGRLCCLIALPPQDRAARRYVRELALVASPMAPYLCRWIVYRRIPDPPAQPDDPPRAA